MAAASSSSKSSSKKKWWIVAGIVVLIGIGYYFWASSRTTLEEPIEIASSVDSGDFQVALGSLVSASLAEGNEVRILQDGDEIFPAMLEDIRSAERSVNLETFIWKSGEVSDRFIEALTERARAGVKARIIIDGMGSIGLEDDDRERLRDAGVELVTYGRERWYEIKADISHRTHRKLLIVDGEIGYTGGVAIADAWRGNGEQAGNWRDIQIRVEGPATRQMQAVFVANWLQTKDEALVGPEYFPAIETRGSVFANCYKSGPDENPTAARLSYLMAIAAAKESIKIGQAYFIPDDLAIEMLLRARERGVDVQVVVPGETDSGLAKGASRSRWRPLLEAGVKLYEYEPALYHCKVMIVDDLLVTVGSVNFDNRSFAINDEVNVILIDKAMARRFAEIFAEDLSRSTAYTLQDYEDRPFYVKLWDYACGLLRSQL